MTAAERFTTLSGVTVVRGSVPLSRNESSSRLPNAARLAALVSAFGALATVVGLVLTTLAAVGMWRSARIQRGPAVLGVVTAVEGAQNATIRYVDHTGTTRHLVARVPVGFADHALAGMSTTVVYDEGAPQWAELPGEPRWRWQDVAAALGKTALLTGWWIRLALNVRRNNAPDRVADVTPDVRGDDHGAGLAPKRASARQVAGAGALIVAVLFAGGRMLIQIANATRPQALYFAPLPPEPVDDGQPVNLPEKLSASPPSSGPLVTPETAAAVFEAVWPIRDQALIDRDVATLRAIEGDPVLAVDLSRIRERNPPNRYVVTSSMPQYATFVPRQDRWPVRFLVEALTTTADTPFLEIMVFVRQGPAEPWKIVFDTGISANEHYTPALHAPLLDAEGYNLVPEAWFEPSELVPSVARYWQSWLEYGRPAAGMAFAEGTWTTDFGRRIANRQDKKDGTGLAKHREFGVPATPPHQLWTFGIVGNSPLVCAPLYETTTVKGPAHQDDARRKWGPDLAPGVYSAVTVEFTIEPCFGVVPGQTEVGVIGGDAWAVRVTGQLRR